MINYSTKASLKKLDKKSRQIKRSGFDSNFI